MGTEKVSLIASLKDQLSAPLNRAGINVKKFGQTAARAGAAVGVMTAALFAAAKKLAEYGAAIYDTARITGVGVERIQALGYQFEQTGGSVDSFQSSLRGLTTFMRMADSATSEQGQLLQKLGLEYESLAGLDSDELFLTMADAIAGVTGEFARMTDAATIFGGRYSQQVVGLINETGGDIRGAIADFEDLGIAMSEEQVTKLKAFDDAMTKFGHTLKGLTADALVPLLDPLLEILEIFIEIAAKTLPALVPAFEKVADVVKLLGEAATNLEVFAPIIVGLTVAILANNVAVSTLGVTYIKTGAEAATFGKISLLLKQNLGTLGLGAAIAFTTDKVIKLFKVIGETNAALDATVDSGAQADEALRIDTIRMVELQRAIDEKSLPALLSLQDELSNMEHFNPTAMINEISEALGVMGTEAIEAAIAQYMLAQSMLSMLAPGTAMGSLIDQQIARLIEMRNEIANTITVTAPVGGEEPTTGGEPDLTAEELKEATLTKIIEEAERERFDSRLARMEEVAEAAQEIHNAELESIISEKQARLVAEKAVEAERQAAHTRLMANMGGYFSKLGEGITVLVDEGSDAADKWRDAWWDAFKSLVVSKAFSALFSVITGGLSSLVDFGSIIKPLVGGGGGKQAGGLISHAQQGLQINSSGAYGDRHLVVVERGEEIIPMEQVNMRRAGAGGSSGSSIQINMNSIYSSLSSLDSNSFADAIIQALRERGVTLE